MTQDRALQLYNQCKGTNYNITDLKFLKNVDKTIKDLMGVDQLSQAFGGGICSRQTIAMIIHFSEKFYD